MAAQDSLKVVSIAGRTDSTGSAVADTDQEEFRLPIGVLLSPGYTTNMLDQTVNANAFRVRQDTGANMNVKVGSGTTKLDGYVVRGTVAGQGSYIVRLDANTKTVTVPATDATNPARYGVYLFINDTAYSGTASRAFADINCIRGTPAGSPTTPGPLAAWSAWVLLWEFQLPANATAVTNTILDSGTSFDRRVPAASPVASALSPRSFASSTERDAIITAPVEGTMAVLRNVDRMTLYNGSAWVHLWGYTSAARIGCRVSRLAAFSIANSVVATTPITFDTEDNDPDGWAPGGTFNQLTVPTGFGGTYLFEVRVNWASNPGASGSAFITINGTDYAIGDASAGAVGASVLGRLYTGFFELAPTNTINVKLGQNSGGAINITAAFDAIRLAM